MNIYSSLLRKAILFPGMLQVHRQVMMRSLAMQMVETAGSESSMLIPEYTQHIPDVPGLYANTAFMLWYGWNLEDAAVISSSLAERLSTNVVTIEKMSTPYDMEVIISIGDIIKKGTHLVKWFEGIDKTVENTRFMRAGVTVPGIVKDVEVYRSLSGVNVVKNVRITVECKYMCNVGSKISNMHSSKSIISKILPDDRMPHCNGIPVDIIISPYSIARRMAPSCIMELMLNTYIKKLRKVFDNNELNMVITPFDSDLTFHAVASNLELLGIPGDCMYYLTDSVNGKLYANKTLFGPTRLGRLHHHAPDKVKFGGDVVINQQGIAMRGVGNQRYGREETEVFTEYGAIGIINELKHHQGKTDVVNRIYDMMSCIGYEIME